MDQINKAVNDFKKLPYYSLKDCRDLLTAYIEKEDLNKDDTTGQILKGGQIRLNVKLVPLLA
jgi:hypothetical protein